MSENENNNEEVVQTEEDINRLMQVRIDKLKELQEQGKDPFEITKYDRTEFSNDIKDNYEKYEGKDVFVLSTLITKEKPEEDEENPEEEPVTEEPEEVEKTELQILQEEIGVLPEVGNNIAKVLYIGLTTISLVVALCGVYYINKKDVK